MPKKNNTISNWDALPVVLDIHTAALIFGVSEVTIRRWVVKKILVGTKIGGQLLFDKKYIQSIVSGTLKLSD